MARCVALAARYEALAAATMVFEEHVVRNCSNTARERIAVVQGASVCRITSRSFQPIASRRSKPVGGAAIGATVETIPSKRQAFSRPLCRQRATIASSSWRSMFGVFHDFEKPAFRLRGTVLLSRSSNMMRIGIDTP